MKIYLLRNAETELEEKNIITGNLNSKLTNKGIKQAENLGKYFKNKNISVIYTSELNSSKETAKIIITEFKKKPKIIKINNFNGRDLGFFQGKRWDVISAFYKEYLFRFEDKLVKTVLKTREGEEWDKLYSRVVSAINHITEKTDKRKNILIIGHLDVNRALLRYMGNMAEKEMYVIWQTNAGINLIEYKDEEFNIKMINYILSTNR